MMLSLRPLYLLPRRVSIRCSLFHATSTLLVKRKVIQQFRLADIGEGITECEVIKWCANLAFHTDFRASETASVQGCQA